MSLRWRLIGGIVLLLSALWALTAVWFMVDIRTELREVLDARLASSARMVQRLVASGDLRLPPPEEGGSRPVTDITGLPSTLPTGLTCQLWTVEGRRVTAANGAPPLAGDAIPDGFSTRTVGGEPWRVFALTAPDSDLRILTAERQGLRSALVRDVATAVSAPFLLVLPATVLLVWLAVRRGLGPLERLRRSIRSRSADSLDAIPTRGVPPEVAPLVEALNGLFARLSGAFERERRFTGDAAHELRTPLAGIKTQLQIAQAADGPVRERALAQAEAGLDHMSRLVQQMLTLARLEARPGDPAEPEECAVADVVASVLRELGPAAERRGVRLAPEGDAGDAVAPLPAPMLHTALRNLAENAVEHGPAGSRVTVAAERTPAGVRLRVLDEGPGLPREELGRVTRRFYRAGDGDAPGTGLGLSIVAAIAQRHGLQLRLENRRDTAGLAAVLDVPAAARPDPAPQ